MFHHSLVRNEVIRPASLHSLLILILVIILFQSSSSSSSSCS